METPTSQPLNVQLPNKLKFTFSVTLKMLAIGFLILVLLIPTAQISSLIRERNYRQNDAATEVRASWGGQQEIVGPFLVVPYDVDVLDSKRKSVIAVVHHQFLLLPKTLDIQGQLDPQTLKRGIFNIPVYTSDLKLKGNFLPMIPDAAKGKRIRWEDARVIVGLSDLRSIKEEMKISIGGVNRQLEPLTTSNSLVERGIEATGMKVEPGVELAFDFNLHFAGSERISFHPIGDTTSVSMASSWPSPKFEGNYLPTERNISESGFDARWNVTRFGRAYPSSWVDEEITYKHLKDTSFGLSLIFGTDVYQVATRSVKYANLFIFLTFVVFFLHEVIGRWRIHPVQYLMIGFGMVIFYLLLLSLSEHWGFGVAYLWAAAGTTLLVAGYSRSVLKSGKGSLVIAGVLSALYAYLFTLLRAEDFSLLLGSVGLFIILSVVMYVTRKVDWYAIGQNKE